MKWKWYTCVWAALITAIVCMANQQGPQHAFAWIYHVPAGDKLGHFVLMGVMAFLLNLALRGRTARPGRGQWLVGSALVLALAAAEELSQLFIPGRSFDFADLSAAAAGVLVLGRMSLWLPASEKQTGHANHPQRK